MKNITKFYNYKKLFKIITLITIYNLLPYLTYAQWVKLPNTNLSPNDRIDNLIANSNGILYASQKNYVVKWDGNSWSKLGGVNDTFNGNVRTIAQDKNGNIYAGGNFTNTKGQYYIAKYNGTTWSEFGVLEGRNLWFGGIFKIVIDLNGGLYATGDFFKGNGNYVAKFIGGSFTILGDTNSSPFNYQINALALDLKGNLYAGGAFWKSDIDGNGTYFYVAKWNGNSWSVLGNLDTSFFGNSIVSITTDLKGNVYAGSRTSSSNGSNEYDYLVKWNGNSWSKLGSVFNTGAYSPIKNIVVDESEIIYVAGYAFKKGSRNYNSVNKWDGSSWSEIGSSDTFNFYDGIQSIAYDNKGTLYATGKIYTEFKYYVAKYNISPTITSFTPTYVSSGGTVTIKGKNFNGTNSVTFGGVVASSFTVINDTTINAIVGNGSTGNVSVTTLGGSSTLAGFILNPNKLGISELQINQLQLYPNPAQETITIKSDMNLNGKEYCIFDFVGKSVLKGKFSDDIKSVSVSELNNGVYILTIYDFNNKLISTNKVAIIK
jgi:hypothetical protein